MFIVESVLRIFLGVLIVIVGVMCEGEYLVGLVGGCDYGVEIW